MSQGTCLVYGFFALASGRRVAVSRLNSSNPQADSSKSPSRWFCFYTTSLQCANHDAIDAQLRVYSPRDDIPLQDNTIAFVLAKLHVPSNGTALLDALTVHPVPGDPQDEAYEGNVPDMPYPFVFGLGTTQGAHQTLADSASRGFLVRTSERVRDEQMASELLYVIRSKMCPHF